MIKSTSRKQDHITISNGPFADTTPKQEPINPTFRHLFLFPTCTCSFVRVFFQGSSSSVVHHFQYYTCQERLIAFIPSTRSHLQGIALPIDAAPSSTFGHLAQSTRSYPQRSYLFRDARHTQVASSAARRYCTELLFKIQQSYHLYHQSISFLGQPPPV